VTSKVETNQLLSMFISRHGSEWERWRKGRRGKTQHEVKLTSIACLTVNKQLGILQILLKQRLQPSASVNDGWCDSRTSACTHMLSSFHRRRNARVNFQVWLISWRSACAGETRLRCEIQSYLFTVHQQLAHAAPVPWIMLNNFQPLN